MARGVHKQSVVNQQWEHNETHQQAFHEPQEQQRDAVKKHLLPQLNRRGYTDAHTMNQEGKGFLSKEKIWSEKYNEAYRMVVLEEEFPIEHKKLITQWIRNARNVQMTKKMERMYWEIGVFCMYTNEQIIKNSETLKGTLGFKNWQMWYLKKRGTFSEDHKKMLVDRDIFTNPQLNVKVRSIKRKRLHV